jgi:4-alpha-glucanotransferase
MIAKPLSRAAGLLLHPTSLPGPHGIGDLGPTAHAFVDWLGTAGMRLWQVLPLVPTGDGGSPYSSWSALAGNPDLIDLGGLADAGLLEPGDALATLPSGDRVDLAAARAFRMPRLEAAAERLLGNRQHPWHAELEQFRAESPWLEDHALFATLRELHGAPFTRWPRPLRNRNAQALKLVAAARKDRVAAATALQFFFTRQWRALRQHARQAGVQIVGDLPIYVDADSADVWANRSLFQLDDEGRPSSVAGVPPDAFSATGQLWGNPLYDWRASASDDHGWWRRRVARALELFDVVRIDHFRAFAAYWEVPAFAPDARAGRWVPGPGLAFFEAVARALGPLPLVAENLGIIDEPVNRLLADSGLPGMHVLQFGFGDDAANVHLPHNHAANGVAYTGTHDNDTTLGWWLKESDRVKHHVRLYLGVDGHDLVWDFIRAVLSSVARFAIVPMQDVLAKGSEARMNTPATIIGNWGWRMSQSALRDETAARLKQLAALYGRL